MLKLKIKLTKMLWLTFMLSLTIDALCQVHVDGYYRKDGTYIEPHFRSDPDGIKENNWSYPGNYNPYTGKIAGEKEIEYYISPYLYYSVPNYETANKRTLDFLFFNPLVGYSYKEVCALFEDEGFSPMYIEGYGLSGYEVKGIFYSMFSNEKNGYIFSELKYFSSSNINEVTNVKQAFIIYLNKIGYIYKETRFEKGLKLECYQSDLYGILMFGDITQNKKKEWIFIASFMNTKTY